MELTQESVQILFSKFTHNQQYKSYKILQSGHINTTVLIETLSEKNFVLQRINSFVFTNPKAVIRNKIKVSNHLHNKFSNLPVGQREQQILSFVNAVNNQPFFVDAEGNYWHLTVFVKNSITHQSVTSKKIAFEAGKIYGDFLNNIADFPIQEIEIILPNFHSMSLRFKQFYEAMRDAKSERVKLAHPLINFAEKHKAQMHILEKLMKAGQLKERLTHNDTKISNVLFTANGKAICVIDTDTVMPGIVHYDFGDAVRTICSNATEDEQDLNKVSINLEYFKAFTRGFLQNYNENLTVFDVENLALAAKTITFIMGLRMLTDFLNNDCYYKTSYNLHNLDRAKNQFKLVESIEKNFDLMNNISLNLYRKLNNKTLN
jgi:thiamine kinase-like enzyme